MLVVISVFFWDKMGVDDPVGAISVHGVNGFFGVLCVGLFSTGDYGSGWNGVYGSRLGGVVGSDNLLGIMPIGSACGAPWFSSFAFKQLGVQLIGGLTCVVFGFIMAFVWFKISNLITPIRAERDAELQGCDIPEMGALAYPDFELKTTMSMSEIGHSSAKV